MFYKISKDEGIDKVFLGNDPCSSHNVSLPLEQI